MGVSCKNCGGTQIDHDAARGDAVCINCGSVVENLCIVNEVEFQENSAGNASVIGQFVSAEGGHNSISSGFKYGMGRDHRQIILDNGRQMLNTMGGQLKMSRHCLDSAFMFYKMAVSKRFTSGRRTIHVLGACLYLVSRTEKTPHMLLDICDVVQCDVVTLGRVFLCLARELCIDCPIVDPSLYIHRFAHQLDFGDKENEVALTALRIMARMKKDWIHFGRRPSALCGAALIIAGKLFNFNVTMDDIIKLVRMSKTTVFKRLMDFSKTATGKLTTDEFKTVDLEEEADPPCYTLGRIRVKFAQEHGEKYTFVSGDVLSQVVKTQEQLKVLLDKRKIIQCEIEQTADEAESFDYRTLLPSDYSLYKYELDEKGEFKIPNVVIDKNNDEETDFRNNRSLASSTLLMDNSIKRQEDENSDGNELPNIKKLKGEDESEEIGLEGIDDDEIDQLLLTEEEIKIKTEVWLEENKEYLQKMKEKEEAERLKEEEEENKDGFKKKRKFTKRKQKDRPVCGTADEAIKTMLAERKLSSKINYDVLRGLKSEDKTESDFNVIKTEHVETELAQNTKHTKISNMESAVEDMPIVYESGPTKQNKKRSAPSIFPSFGANAKVSKVDEAVNESPVLNMTTVVESGPVHAESAPLHADDNEDYEEDDDDEDKEVITVSALFAKEVDDLDVGYDDDGDAFY